MSLNFAVLGLDYYSTKIGGLKIKGMFSMAVVNQFIKLLVFRTVLFQFLHYLYSKL